MSAAAEQNSSRYSSKSLLGLLLLILLVGLVLVALINYFLNPMIYRSSYMKTAALHLEEGKNYSIYDPNINWRAFRRQHIQVMESKPDIVVSGGSRWQEASTDLVPNQELFNAHGHSDYNEDFFAITHLLEENDLMPKTLVLSLRYRIFEPIEDRAHTGWREFMPEYRAMAEKLGIETPPWHETMRTEHWLALLSIGDLWANLSRRMGSELSPGPTEEKTLRTLDVIGSDGSLRWSEDNAALFTSDYAREDALKRLARFEDFELKVDPAMVEATDKLFAYLSERDVNLVLAQTPFHPAFYDGIRERQFGQVLDQIEMMADEFGEKYGIPVVGSFSPHKVGCAEEQFIDWHHGTPDCLQLVFDEMNLGEGEKISSDSDSEPIIKQ